MVKQRDQELVNKLEQEGCLTAPEFEELLTRWTKETRIYAGKKARAITDRIFGNKIYVRGLVEFSSYCKNDCYYCGLRRGNTRAERYRLTKEEILSCCEQGYQLGFRTFVLQGGEDMAFTVDRFVEIIRAMKEKYPECAITLSIGEKELEDYAAMKEAGADRFLLRHETADSTHYNILHPEELSLKHRMQCLKGLHQLGFQTGCGFMVGSPGQTVKTLVKDLMFIQEFSPEMVGLGPFIPHKDTPFKDQPHGDLELTLLLLSLVRLIKNDVLLPATTALGTICSEGRELGIEAGANVLMPNLSPMQVRKKYLLYNDKISTGEEAAESIRNLSARIRKIGYELVSERGDYRKYEKPYTSEIK